LRTHVRCAVKRRTGAGSLGRCQGAV
jgi:hypothetical protein